MSKITYNERSWGIDLITYINKYADSNPRTIKRAGGENTISYGKKSLFPDVLLFGENSEILIGWELKFPDTPITDEDFIKKAKLKATLLGLNSFLIWNVCVAILYLKKEKEFEPIKTWNNLKSIITKRELVPIYEEEWKNLLFKILKDLNNLFEDGVLQKKTFVETFKDSVILNYILKNKSDVSEKLVIGARRNAIFSSETNIWWKVNSLDYPRDNKWEVLAQILLVNWINKFLFAHILTAFNGNARKIEKINENTSIGEALNVFKEISIHCDFFNIFEPQLGEEYLPIGAWEELKQLNLLLNNIEFISIKQELIQDLLATIISSSKRKIAGQYVTPIKLAQLLIRISMLNKEKTIYDPCCGTGTITRVAYDIKKETNIISQKAIKTIFASDKVGFPLQMATLALIEPSNIGQVLQVFKKDCTEIEIGNELEFKEPNTGKTIKRDFQPVDYICSNLPFVQQEDIEILNPGINERTNAIISDHCSNKIELNDRTDLYSYLPFHFWKLLKNNGRLGIITSNSWLGTQWGEIYIEAIDKFYHIESVIISGKGKWFKDSNVVTTITILNKRTEPKDRKKEETNFITLNRELDTLDKQNIVELSDFILLKKKKADLLDIETYKTNFIMKFDLNWNALFTNINWLKEIENKLTEVTNYFTISRGERRGWNKLFYPKGEHRIEPEFIKPVLKSPVDIDSLIAIADSEAFCCSKSTEELKKSGKTGALNWIKKFEFEVNLKGKPLPQVLKRKNMYWYEMNNSTLADLVANINYGERIFIARLKERSFVNQRFTRFIVKDPYKDIELLHALLSSIIGIFYIEGLGFGRGLGALDLSAERMRKLKILNPELLKNNQKMKIIDKFKPLLEREILSIPEELQQEDRQEFDNTVLESFGIKKYKNNILNSFLRIFEMRQSVIS